MDAFDADVVIYAAVDGHPQGRRVRALFDEARARPVGLGSFLLLPEVLSHPLRREAQGEIERLMVLLGALELHPIDRAIAERATALAAKHRLRTADAIHLATAVELDADRFVTNNAKDFPRSIDDIEITYPDDLAAP